MADLALNPWGLFQIGSYRDLEIGTLAATVPALGVTGSVLRMVGPVSVYCDWVRACLICSLCLRVAARIVAYADPSLKYQHVACTLSNKAVNKQTRAYVCIYMATSLSMYMYVHIYRICPYVNLPVSTVCLAVYLNRLS